MCVMVACMYQTEMSEGVKDDSTSAHSQGHTERVESGNFYGIEQPVYQEEEQYEHC
jgi:hypothetical protein